MKRNECHDLDTFTVGKKLATKIVSRFPVDVIMGDVAFEEP